MEEDLDLAIEYCTSVSINPTIRFEPLGKEFYLGMRNELTAKRIDDLSEMILNIPEPIIFGTYNNEEHFFITLDFFLKCTNETRHRGWFFLKYILPKVQNNSKLLDVGPGNGILTKWVAKKFNHVTIIDSNYDAINIFSRSRKILKNQTDLNKIHGSILSESLPSNYFDLAILSHVLYYIDYSKWLEVTMRVYDSVKAGGIIVIVLNGDQYGKLELIKYFNGKLLPINVFAQKCISTFGESNVELFKSMETAKVKNELSMLHIAGFFLYDVGARSEKASLIDYMNAFLKKPDGSFSIDFAQKFIIIYK